MKRLIVYYSRSGTTRTVATGLAKTLSADVEELVDTKNRKGALGSVVAGKDAVLKRYVAISPPKTSPADYDLVIVGTPVWASTMCSAVRAYLTDFGANISKAAVFCTAMSAGMDETLEAMARMIGGSTIARMGFRQKEVRKGLHREKLNAFLADVTAEGSPDDC